MANENLRQAIPPPVFDVLRTYLQARAAFADGDFDIVRVAFLYKQLPAGQFSSGPATSPDMRCSSLRAL